MLQLVSRHEIEYSGFRFKKFRTELQRVVGLHQIVAGNVITYSTKLSKAVSSFGVVVTLAERNILLRHRSEINIKKVQKQDLKKH